MDRKFYKRYVGRFILIVIPVFILMGMLPVPGIFNVVAAAVVAFYIGTVFAKDHGRLPEASEQNRFAVGAFLAIVVVVGLLTTLFVSIMPEPDKAAFMAQFEGRSITAMIVGTALAVLMLWGTIHFGFGLGGRKHMKSLEKKSSV